MTLLDRARSFSPERHRAAGQLYNGEPYSVHLAHVESVLRRFGVEEEEMLAAAWLHDLVEDTDTTIEEVRAEFGERVAFLVYHVTDRPGKNRRARHEATYPPLAAAVDPVQLKLADRIANMEVSLRTSGPPLSMYVREYIYFRDTLHTPGHFEPMWAELDRLIQEGRARI